MMKTKIISVSVGFMLGLFVAFMILTNTAILRHLPRDFTPLYLPLPSGFRQLPLDGGDVVPDESTAIIVANAYFEAHFGERTPTALKYGLDYKSDSKLNVKFLKNYEGKRNAWRVSYSKASPDSIGGYSSAMMPEIIIWQDSGELDILGLQPD